MTKKQATDLYLLYDLKPWYWSRLEQEKPKLIEKLSPWDFERKCFNLFYEEVKNQSETDWLKGLEECKKY